MPQCNNNTTIIDSRFFSEGYGTEEARLVFCDLRRLQRWLEVETVLAECQAELGIIPSNAAVQLAKTALIKNLDITTIQSDIATTGHSLVPLLREWQRVSDPEAGQYIHYGATTQDIQDTAQSLELLEITTIIERDLSHIIHQLKKLSDEHRNLTMIGRSHGQHALPTTLGLKIAGWLDESIRNYKRLQHCKNNLLVSQLFGGVGTMAALSDQAHQLLGNFSNRLGLNAPLIAWHSSRDRTAEFINLLALLTGGLARVANEICQLARNEIDELNEPFEFGQIGSTTMPHKKNPELCEQIVVLSRLVKANSGTGLDTLCNEHERDYRAVRLEWVAVTESSIFSCAALALSKKVLHGLTVNKEKIAQNLERAAVMVSTEALMFLVGKKIGKQHAHDLIYRASLNLKTGEQLLDKLLSYPEVQTNFSANDLKKAIAPDQQTGMAGKIIDQVIKSANTIPKSTAKNLECPLRRGDLCPK